MVTEVTLKLADNVPMIRSALKMERSEYLAYFKEKVRNNGRRSFTMPTSIRPTTGAAWR